MHLVTDTELEDLASGYNSVNFGFFTLFAGVAVSFIITLVTVKDLPMDMRAIFIAISLAAGALTLYFGVMYVQERSRAKNMVRKLRDSR